MAGGQRGEGLVYADEVASDVPGAARRPRARPSPSAALRRTGFLTPENARTYLQKLASAEGFDAFGVTTPDAIPQAAGRLREALASAHHATMGWLEERAGERGSPATLWPAGRSIVMLGMNYGPDADPLATLVDRQGATISVYARNRDYHDLIKGALKRIASQFAAQAGVEVKVFVDTAPVMEKPLAMAAGLGWQGKHTNLVSRDLGAWLFLGAIFTSAELPVDAAEPEHCGSCQACLDACPTAAFPGPFRLDARRCISYLTIEHKGPVDRDLRPLLGNRIYGCDDCLAVCPWNKFAAAAREIKLQARPDLVAPRLAVLARLDDAGFRTLFSGSPVKRIGRGRFVRNVLYAIGNSGDVELAGEAGRLLADDDPQVRGAAVWAFWRLVASDAFAAEAGRRVRAEADGDVLAEWREALAA